MTVTGAVAMFARDHRAGWVDPGLAAEDLAALVTVTRRPEAAICRLEGG